MALTFVERFHRTFEQAHAGAELVCLGEALGLAGGVVGDPVLPFGFAVHAADRGVERGVAAGRHAAVHRSDFLFSHAELGGDRGEVLRAQVAFFHRADFAFEAAQVEEQLFLGGRCAEFHQRPRAQDVFLDRGADPPHCIGREAEAFVRVELLHGLHQADITFGNDLAHGQAIAAIAHRDLRHEAEVGRHHLLCGFRILMLGPALGEHELFVLLEQRVFANFREITRQPLFRGECNCEAGHVMRLLLFLSAAPIWGEQAAELVYYPGTFRPSLDPNAPIL